MIAKTVALAALLAASTGCITDRILVGSPPQADPVQFQRVEDETARLRHLPFTRPVPVDVMTVEQLRAWFDQYATQRKAALEREDRFFHRMNILPPTVSTAEAYKGFLADFVGGIYDDGSKKMILVSDYAWWAKLQQDVVGYITGVDWAYEVFLAHELTHALQDQHFGLGDMLQGGVYDDNDDAAFVRKTLLETEANVVGMAHFLGMDLEKLATRKAFFLFMRYNNLLNGPLMMALSGKTPSFFAKQTFSQYELGLSFVEEKLDDGGMDELSRAYVRGPGERGGLPESTEQLLWPKKMRADSLDRPIPIARLDGPPASIPGSSLVITNVFGALACKHWFEREDGPLVGNAVADGWGGDRWDIIDDGGVSLLVWRTTWDSDGDAQEFVDAYAQSVPVRYGERAVVVDEHTWAIPAAASEEHSVRTTRDERVVLERRGKDVLVVEGTTPAETQPLVDEMWRKLARGAPPHVHEAKLADKRAALEAHLQESRQRIAAEPERTDLLGRLFLPARTMAIRLGTGVSVDAQAPNGVPPRLPQNDIEMRWGFRPGLELSLPLGLAGSVRTAAGQSVASITLREFYPRPTFSLGAEHAIPIGTTLAVVAQGSLDDVDALSLGDGTLAFARGHDRSFLPGATWRVAGGALLRPLPALVLAPAIARADLVDDAAGEVVPTVILGGALRRGSTTQPLVELEVIPGLFVYETSAFFLDENARGLELHSHTHALGLLLYF